MERSDVRKIDYIFYHEQEIRRACREARLDRPRQNLLIYQKSRSKSDPTAMQAVFNLTPIKQINMEDSRRLELPERWLKVIEETYARSELSIEEVARAKYQGIERDEILKRFGITLNQYYHKTSRFREIAYEIGKIYQLFV